MARKSPAKSTKRSDPRRGGYPYPVRPEWKEDVRAKLASMGIDAKELARRVHCAQSTMSDMLSKPEVRGSVLVPAIHAALGWDPPPDPQSPPMPSADAIEMGHLFDRLPEDVRRKLRDDAEFYLRRLTENKH